MVAGGVAAGSGVVAGSGSTVLPYTSGNHLAVVLAYAAIAIGLSLLASQVAVRIIRKKYQK
jgi:hypothetical protein